MRFTADENNGTSNGKHFYLDYPSRNTSNDLQKQAYFGNIEYADEKESTDSQESQDEQETTGLNTFMNFEIQQIS